MDTLFTDVLGGVITDYNVLADRPYFTTTNIAGTRLGAKWTLYADDGSSAASRSNVASYFPVDDFTAKLEELSRNITVSLLARPGLAVGASAKTMCDNRHDINVYEFDVRFWISYGTGLLLSALAVAMGIYCIWSMGRAREANFTTIAANTRDRRIDEIIGQAAGPSCQPVEERLADVNLKFTGRFEVVGR